MTPFLMTVALDPPRRGRAQPSGRPDPYGARKVQPGCDRARAGCGANSIQTRRRRRSAFLDQIERDAERTFAAIGESMAQRLDLTADCRAIYATIVVCCASLESGSTFASLMAFCSVKPWRPRECTFREACDACLEGIVLPGGDSIEGAPRLSPDVQPPFMEKGLDCERGLGLEKPEGGNG